MTDSLAQRLRDMADAEPARYLGGPSDRRQRALREAADALEALAAERDRWQTKHELLDQSANLTVIPALRQRIKELEAERDRALGAMRGALVGQARLAAAERVVDSVKAYDQRETMGNLSRKRLALAAYDAVDWVQKSEWIDPILKDALSGKRKAPDLNSAKPK